MSNTSTPEPAVFPRGAPPPENTPPGEKIANLLIGSGHLTEKQFRYAKQVRSKLPPGSLFTVLWYAQSRVIPETQGDHNILVYLLSDGSSNGLNVGAGVFTSRWSLILCNNRQDQ